MTNLKNPMNNMHYQLDDPSERPIEVTHYTI